MSPTPPTLNPSQTVERIREIIVGRHLERLEGRVARLESAPAVATPLAQHPIFEDRLLITEAKVEALQEHVHRLDSTREETLRLAVSQREDARHLAAQIQEIAREKAEATVLPAVEKLERKLGAWLGEWQKSLHLRLEERDGNLAEKIRTELAEMKEGIDKRFSDLERKIPENVEDRFNKIAAAARALADSAASFSSPVQPQA